MVLLIFSLLIATTIGYFLVSSLLANRQPSYFSPGLKLSLAVGAGYGFSSCLYFIWLVSLGRSSYGFIATETLVLIILSVYFIRAKKRSHHEKNCKKVCHESSTFKTKIFKILPYGFYFTMVLCLTIFLLMSRLLPHGGWDAWQTWNLFARFIYRGGVHWKDAFTPLLAPHHPDYPLLIPALVARSWQYIGAESQLVPILIAFSFCFATIWLLFSTISAAKSKGQAYLAGIILMGTISYVVLGTYQYADVPLGFYYLAALSLILLQDLSPNNRGISLLVGTMAGFACWTKNEGFLFLSAIISARLILILIMGNKKAILIQLFYLVVGASMVLAVVLYFKYEMAPLVDLFMKQNMTVMFDKLRDPSRYLVVINAFFKITLNTNPLFFLVVFFPLYSGVSIEPRMKESLFTIFMVMVIMYAGYLAFYIITPYDLEWHLETSLSRLLMQLWPSCILAIFLATRSPEAAFGINSNIDNCGCN